MATALLTAVGVGAKTAATISSVFSAVSTAAGLAGSIAAPMIQARNQSAVMQANANLADKEARDREVQSSIAAERQRRRNRAVMAEQEAGAAESGVLSGTSLDLLDQNSVALELDALTTEYNGTVEANNLRDRAAYTRSNAGMVKSAGTLNAVGAGIAGAGAAYDRIDGLNF